MSTSEPESVEMGEEEDEGKLYQWIFEWDEKKKPEYKQIPHSSGHTPAPSEIISEERIDADGSSQKVVEDIQEVKQPNQNVQFFEEKPWRKPGAEISDYFNYGFDEESWRAYYLKQTQLQAFQRHQGTKILAKNEHAQHGNKVLSCASSSSARRSIKACRESEDDIDVSGGQAGQSSRDKMNPSLTGEVNNSQVITEMSNKVDDINQCDLPPPVNFNSLLAFVSPPSSLFRSGCSPSSPPAILCSRVPEGFDGPSTLAYQSSSGIMAASPVMTITTKAWECYLYQQKHGRDRDRDKTRRYSHHKKSKRSRYTRQQSFSPLHNSLKYTLSASLAKSDDKEEDGENEEVPLKQFLKQPDTEELEKSSLQDG